MNFKTLDMKRLIIIIIICISLTEYISAEETTHKHENFYIRLILTPSFGILNRDLINNIRRDVQNYSNQLNDALILSAKGNADYVPGDKTSHSYGRFIEGIFFIDDNFGIGILCGYNEYSLKLNCKSGYWADKPEYELKINSIPLHPSLYYKFNITENHKILAGLGPSFNYTTYEYRFSQESDSTLTGDMQFTRKYTGISYGFHGSIEYLYCCDHFLIFSIGVKYDMLQSYNIKNTFTINNEKVNINLQTVSFLISLGIYF